MIRKAEIKDAKDISEIYNHYIRESIVTFEEELVTIKEVEKRLLNVNGTGLPWLVLEEDEKIVGYAYAAKWKERASYRFSAEITVYLLDTEIGKGYGVKLYDALFEELNNTELRTVIAGIALPNVASVRLHEKFGLKKVAHFEKVGFKFDKWIDVGYWQKLLK